MPCNAPSNAPTRTDRRPVFTLPPRLAAKAEPALVGGDEAHLQAVAAALDHHVADARSRLAAARLVTARPGREAVERDDGIRRLERRLRDLGRYGQDLCLGRMVIDGRDEPVHIGRFGLSDAAGRRLLVDWRAPAAEPFFAATHGDPRGLVSRRRYRWVRGHVVDYWDEVFTADGLAGRAALDDRSAFIASLGDARTPRMRDVLATIQSDQDAVIRSGTRGALVVDGGPGTGKTVVALHRAAYLLFADPRVRHDRGGILLVGPSDEYLAYVGDVLPGLGEDSVETATIRRLVPEGARAVPETDPVVARCKADPRLVRAIESAVDAFERPPETTTLIDTDHGELRITAADWAEAFAAAEPDATHNGAREQVWDTFVEIVADRTGARGAVAPRLRVLLRRDPDVTAAFDRAWPLLDPTAFVARLWSDPAALRDLAPWLDDAELAALPRDDAAAWTTADLPLLDAARMRIGDPGTASRRGRVEAEAVEARAVFDDVVHHLIAADDDGEGRVTMLRGEDARHSLVDDGPAVIADRGALDGPFAHLVVDEAQELTDAEWLMLLRRCPSRSLTIVGDRAQARHGFAASWAERLAGIGVHEPRIATLTVNYRTPGEVMALAEPEIRAVIPDANVPSAVRWSGVPVRFGAPDERDAILAAWLGEHPEGTACVIGDLGFAGWDGERGDRVRSLSATQAKGLEFDLVVLVDPAALGEGIEGAVDRYVAMTRATGALVVLTPHGDESTFGGA